MRERARRLLILGGSTGIGKEVLDQATKSWGYTDIHAYGEHDFNIQHQQPLAEAVEELAPTDVVYCVGINRLDWIRDAKVTDFVEVMKTNVWGFLNTIQQLDAHEEAPCNVVAVTSDAAWRPMRTSAIYCASKSALEMAVRVASREYAPRGWRINAVAPGKVEDTPMTDYVDAKVLELRGWSVAAAEAYEVASTPLGRKVTKEEVAEVILSTLNGPKAQTGEIIAVNGGR